MSNEDRERWNHRYAEGIYRARPHPTPLLVDWLDKIPKGRALDLACGAGRNSLFLAEKGFEVLGVDISEVALQQARAKQKDSHSVLFESHDLESGFSSSINFDVIVMVRYVNHELLASLPAILNVNGMIITEQHLAIETDRELSGPMDPRFRVEPGSLKAAIPGLRLVHEFEGFAIDPLGEEVALSQLVAVKGNST